MIESPLVFFLSALASSLILSFACGSPELGKIFMIWFAESSQRLLGHSELLSADTCWHGGFDFNCPRKVWNIWDIELLATFAYLGSSRLPSVRMLSKVPVAFSSSNHSPSSWPSWPCSPPPPCSAPCSSPLEPSFPSCQRLTGEEGDWAMLKK